MKDYPNFNADYKRCFPRHGAAKRIGQGAACERLREYGRSLPQFEQAVEDSQDDRTRQVHVTRKDCLLVVWSNASRKWWAHSGRLGRTERGQTLFVDANQIVVCGLGQKRADALAMALPEMPGYKYSYEGRTRGGGGLLGVRGYPYYIVTTRKLRPEFDQFRRQRGLPESAVRRISGASKTAERRFDDEAEALRFALDEDRAGGQVEVLVVQDPQSHRRQVRDWRHRAQRR